jgi:pimeloyl-ACP methyl ester carboxylesterase
MKDAKVIVVPGAGHISHIQKSELFNKDVIEFLK